MGWPSVDIKLKVRTGKESRVAREEGQGSGSSEEPGHPGP